MLLIHVPETQVLTCGERQDVAMSVTGFTPSVCAPGGEDSVLATPYYPTCFLKTQAAPSFLPHPKGAMVVYSSQEMLQAKVHGYSLLEHPTEASSGHVFTIFLPFFF